MIAVGDHVFGRVPEILVRASCPFGGGVAGTKEELCGILSGAALILGAQRGRLSPDEQDEPLRQLLRTYRERFAARFGGTQCKPILDSFPDTPRRCDPAVREGTAMLMEMLE